jgi:hypothetical protein
MSAWIRPEIPTAHDVLIADCDEHIRATRSLIRHLLDAEVIYVDSMERSLERIRKSREILQSLHW